MTKPMCFDFVTMLDNLRAMKDPTYYLSFIMDNYTNFMSLTGCTKDSKRYRQFYFAMTSVPIPLNKRGADFLLMLDTCFVENPVEDLGVQLSLLKHFCREMFPLFDEEETHTTDDMPCVFYFTGRGVLIAHKEDGAIIGFYTMNDTGDDLYIRVYDERVYTMFAYLEPILRSPVVRNKMRLALDMPTGVVN